MDKRAKLEQILEELHLDALVPDGFDNAIVGVITHDSIDTEVIYSIEQMISVLATRDGMTYDDALEFIYFNVEGTQPQSGLYYDEEAMDELIESPPRNYIPITIDNN